MEKPAVTKQKPTHGQYLIKKETGLSLIKTKPKKTPREISIKKGVESILGKTKSAVTNGQQIIKKGANSSKKGVESILGKTKSAVTNGQQIIKKGANSSSKTAKSTVTGTHNFIKRSITSISTKTTMIMNGGQAIIIGNYLAIQTFLKKHQEKKTAKKQEIPYSWFLLVSLVILFVDRDIFLGEREGQLTTGWVGFCLGWFTRDKTASTKSKILIMSLFGLFAVIKWLFLLL